MVKFNFLTSMKLSYRWYYSIFSESGLLNFLIQKGGLIGEGAPTSEKGLEREFTVLAEDGTSLSCNVLGMFNANLLIKLCFHTDVSDGDDSDASGTFLKS